MKYKILGVHEIQNPLAAATKATNSPLQCDTLVKTVAPRPVLPHLAIDEHPLPAREGPEDGVEQLPRLLVRDPMQQAVHLEAVERHEGTASRRVWHGRG